MRPAVTVIDKNTAMDSQAQEESFVNRKICMQSEYINMQLDNAIGPRYKRQIMDIQELYTTAELAHIELKPEELSVLQRGVEQMITFFEKMSEVDVASLQPTTHAFNKGNRLRPDTVNPSDLADDMLEQAPDLEDRFIVIPNVL